MTNEPVDLDKHRRTATGKAAEISRQRLNEFHADRAALQQRQDEIEKALLTAPAMTWAQAAAKAEYLLRLFDATPEAREPYRRKLIADVIEEFNILYHQSDDPN